jgi:hypothetical protein
MRKAKPPRIEGQKSEGAACLRIPSMPLARAVQTMPLFFGAIIFYRVYPNGKPTVRWVSSEIGYTPVTCHFDEHGEENLALAWKRFLPSVEMTGKRSK